VSLPADRWVQAVSGRINEGSTMSTMSNPRSNLSSISRTLEWFARYGDLADLQAYVRGAAFRDSFHGLDPERRQTAMLLFAEAHARCEARAKSPLPPPVALNGRVSAKLNWRDPTKLAKLAQAYARAKDHKGAGRLLGMSAGAARLDKLRYLDRPQASGPKKPL
jgi:hypothetical protein